MEEILWTKNTDKGTSAGPEGLNVQDFLEIENETLRSAYSQVLEIGISTTLWQAGRTVLIPKTENSGPSDFRPITVSSVVNRGLHKMMARRIQDLVPIGEMQRGFKNEDAVAANLLILQQLIKEVKTTPCPLYLAFIDFKKAFESVSHGAITTAAQTVGLDKPSVDYLASVYGALTVNIMGEWVT